MFAFLFIPPSSSSPSLFSIEGLRWTEGGWRERESKRGGDVTSPGSGSVMVSIFLNLLHANLHCLPAPLPLLSTSLLCPITPPFSSSLPLFLLCPETSLVHRIQITSLPFVLHPLLLLLALHHFLFFILLSSLLYKCTLISFLASPHFLSSALLYCCVLSSQTSDIS